MSDQPSPMVHSRSQIPIPINRRHSMNILQQSTNSLNSNASSSRAISPLLSKGAPISAGKSVTPVSNPGAGGGNGGGRRYSLLPAGNGRKPSFGEKDDEPAHLKAQIALLQSSLHASHQRIVNLTSELNFSTSTATSPGGLSPGLLPTSPGLWSPGGTLDDLPEVEGLSFTDDSMGGVNDVKEEPVAESSQQTRPPSASSNRPRGLPHSNSSYDLRGRAATPGRDGMTAPESRLGLHRIPQSTVTQNLSLHPTYPGPSPSHSNPSHPSPTHFQSSPTNPHHLNSPFIVPGGLESPLLQTGRLSPGPRHGLGGGGSSVASTRVIDALQTELINTRGHLERVKQEMRGGQRLIGSLTRQSEDLKETRERMRMECEGLNNVIARKERLLQEVLERARTAESTLQALQTNKKTLEQTTKKAIATATSQVTEAQAGQARAEREAGSLRESVKSLRDVWAREIRGVKEEVKKGEERWRGEMEAARDKHLALVKLIQSQSAERANIQLLSENAQTQHKIASEAFNLQIRDMRVLVDRSADETREARAQAAALAEELAHLRHLMRKPRRDDLDEAAQLGKATGDDKVGTTTD